MDELVNSADSHLFEPWPLLEDRFPKHLQDRAPAFREIGGRSCLYMENQIYVAYDPNQFEEFAEATRREGESDEDIQRRLGESAHGGFVPDLRIEAMDIDGVWGEVIYPTTAFGCFAIEDHELGTACVKVYNDFVAEALGGHKRFAPVAMIRPNVIEDAVAEIERIASLGLRGFVLPIDPGDKPYSLEMYDPIWSAAIAHGLPVSFHVGGHAGAGDWCKEFTPNGDTTDFREKPFVFEPRPDLPPGNHSLLMVRYSSEAHRTLAWLAGGAECWRGSRSFTWPSWNAVPDGWPGSCRPSTKCPGATRTPSTPSCLSLRATTSGARRT